MPSGTGNRHVLEPVLESTTESMAMSPVKLEPTSPTKLTLATPLGRLTCGAQTLADSQ